MTRHEARHDEALQAQDVRVLIGENIKLAQAEAGIERVEDLAHMVGLSLRLVQKHRAGDNAPGHANLIAYARVLGKPVAWFFERHSKRAAA